MQSEHGGIIVIVDHTEEIFAWLYINNDYSFQYVKVIKMQSDQEKEGKLVIRRELMDRHRRWKRGRNDEVGRVTVAL